jgi:hypothetical protein
MSVGTKSSTELLTFHCKTRLAVSTQSSEVAVRARIHTQGMRGKGYAIVKVVRVYSVKCEEEKERVTVTSDYKIRGV